MNKRKVAECARQNKRGESIFIPSPLLEILLVQMLDFKIEDDHLPDRAKGKILVESSVQMNSMINKLNCTRY